jgi:hypothetical protein
MDYEKVMTNLNNLKSQIEKTLGRTEEARKNNGNAGDEAD